MSLIIFLALETLLVSTAINIFFLYLQRGVSRKPATEKKTRLLLLSFRKPDMPHRFAFHRARRRAALVPFSTRSRNHRRGDKRRFESDRF